MGLFKPDFYRFFMFGFAAGAALVVATMDSNARGDIAGGIVPAAQAAPSPEAHPAPTLEAHPER